MPWRVERACRASPRATAIQEGILALQRGLARMQEVIEGHPSGDLSPIAERLERIASTKRSQ